MLLAGVALLGGCSSAAPKAAVPVTVPVQVALPAATSAAETAVCRRLLDAVPSALPGGLARRSVAGDPQRSAAWGNPAVTLACGTSAVTDPAATLIQVGPSQGGVVTFAVVGVDSGTAFTTAGLPVPVTVTVPDAYDSTVLVPLTTPLLQLDH